MGNVNKNQNGFTVVELLLAIAVFGIFVPSLVMAIVAVGRMTDRARDLAYANIIAENKIEGIRSAGYNATPIGTIDFTSDMPATFGSPKSGTYSVIGSVIAGIKEIEVTISYNDHGTTRILKYKSLISEIGVSQ